MITESSPWGGSATRGAHNWKNRRVHRGRLALSVGRRQPTGRRCYFVRRPSLPKVVVIMARCAIPMLELLRKNYNDMECNIYVVFIF
jgi:hypothetical protein